MGLFYLKHRLARRLQATASDQSVSPSCRDRICRARTTVALGQVRARRRVGAPTSTGAVSCASTRHNTGCPSWVQIDTRRACETANHARRQNTARQLDIPLVAQTRELETCMHRRDRHTSRPCVACPSSLPRVPYLVTSSSAQGADTDTGAETERQRDPHHSRARRVSHRFRPALAPLQSIMRAIKEGDRGAWLAGTGALTPAPLPPARPHLGFRGPPTWACWVSPVSGICPLPFSLPASALVCSLTHPPGVPGQDRPTH
jgi:hypothetical protein